MFNFIALRKNSVERTVLGSGKRSAQIEMGWMAPPAHAMTNASHANGPVPACMTRGEMPRMPRDLAIGHDPPPPLQCGGSTLRLHSSENRCVGWPPKPRCTSGRNARAMRFSSSRAMPVDLPRPDSFRPCCISMCAACQGRLDGLHRRIAMRIMEKDGTPPPRGSTILANVAARTGGRAKKSHRVGGRDMRSERRRQWAVHENPRRGAPRRLFPPARRTPPVVPTIVSGESQPLESGEHGTWRMVVE